MTLADVSEHMALQAALMSIAENQLALLSSILPRVSICCHGNLIGFPWDLSWGDILVHFSQKISWGDCTSAFLPNDQLGRLC